MAVPMLWHTRPTFNTFINKYSIRLWLHVLNNCWCSRDRLDFDLNAPRYSMNAIYFRRFKSLSIIQETHNKYIIKERNINWWAVQIQPLYT